jgi:hypothetical protein
MNSKEAARQIHALRLIAPKGTIARVIDLAERNEGVSSFTALRNRSPEDYEVLRRALAASR